MAELLAQFNPETQEVRVPFTITKIDEATRTVEGLATSITEDKQGDVVDFEGSKLAFGQWAGNVREMHQPSAVGKRVYQEFNDADESVLVRSFISQGAEDTWHKLQEGVLTGYSIGGKARTSVQETIQKQDGTDHTRRRITAYDLHELSLVDDPANPDCSVALVKSVGGMLQQTAEIEEVPTTAPAAAVDINVTVRQEEAVQKQAPGEIPPEPPRERPRDIPSEPPSHGPTASAAVGVATTGMSADDVRTALSAQVEQLPQYKQASTLDQAVAAPRAWIEEVYDEAVVVKQEGKYFVHSYSIVGTEVQLESEGREVVQQWQPAGRNMISLSPERLAALASRYSSLRKRHLPPGITTNPDGSGSLKKSLYIQLSRQMQRAEQRHSSELRKVSPNRQFLQDRDIPAIVYTGGHMMKAQVVSADTGLQLREVAAVVLSKGRIHKQDEPVRWITSGGKKIPISASGKQITYGRTGPGPDRGPVVSPEELAAIDAEFKEPPDDIGLNDLKERFGHTQIEHMEIIFDNYGDKISESDDPNQQALDLLTREPIEETMQAHIDMLQDMPVEYGGVENEKDARAMLEALIEHYRSK